MSLWLSILNELVSHVPQQVKSQHNDTHANH